MAEILRAVKGMNDIFPASVPRKASETLPTSNMWQWFEHTARSVLQRYGYQNLMTPIVEPTSLFVRGIGEVTDIVEKEMYSFEDTMNGDKLTLRPEFTAGIVRAVIEHNALYNGPLRLWTMGPMFRHERPLALFDPPAVACRAETIARLKREVNAHHGRFLLRSAATLPLASIYRDTANGYDICDVHGKSCF